MSNDDDIKWGTSEEIEAEIDSVASSLAGIAKLSPRQLDKILQHTKAYVDGYVRAWSDAIQLLAPLFQGEDLIVAQEIASRSKLTVKTRLNTLKQEVAKRLGDATETRSRKGTEDNNETREISEPDGEYKGT